MLNKTFSNVSLHCNYTMHVIQELGKEGGNSNFSSCFIQLASDTNISHATRVTTSELKGLTNF